MKAFTLILFCLAAVSIPTSIAVQVSSTSTDNNIDATIEDNDYLYINNLEEADEITNSNSVVVIFFGSEDSDAYKALLSASKGIPEVLFCRTDEQSLRTKYNIEGEAIVLVRKIDQQVIRYNGEYSAPEITDFINLQVNPPVTPINSLIHYERLMDSELSQVFLFVNGRADNTDVENVFKTVAEDFRSSTIFLLVDINDDDADIYAGSFGVTARNVPAIRVLKETRVQDFELAYDNSNKEEKLKFANDYRDGKIKLDSDVPFNQDATVSRRVLVDNNKNVITLYRSQTLKFVYEDNDITVEKVREFIQDLLGGKVKPYLRSEPVPDTPFEDDARIVVGSTFREIVLDSDDDVLLFCGSRQSEEYEEVRESLAELKDASGLVIAKLDTFANEVPGLIAVTDVIFYPKEDKASPVSYYEYERRLKAQGESQPDLFEWIKKQVQASTPSVRNEIFVEL